MDDFLRRGAFRGVYPTQSVLANRRAAWGLVAGLLLIHSTLLAWNAYVHFPSVDEVAHLPAGLGHLAYKRFDTFHVNPPLVRLVAAAPVALAKAPLPDLPPVDGNPWPRHEFILGANWMRAQPGSLGLHLVRRSRRMGLFRLGPSALWN
jgi:hypothetical protein